MKGILIKAISGFYYVKSEDNVYECKARGSFRNKNFSPVVGDNVEFLIHENSYPSIEEIYPRKNCLVRPNVANIDKLFIVSSFSTPSPNTVIIDRLTAICAFYNIEPVIVFNKADLGDFSEFLSLYKKAGFKAYVVSAATGEGIEQLKEEVKGCISAFTGNSGVGKSSILNVLFKDLNLQTGEVSQKLGRGRHTTRHTELFWHKFGGFVADTPGFSSLENIELGFAFKERLAECFLDFSDYTHLCKFTSCSHTKEKGCAVINAVNNGDIQESRHKTYCMLYDELKNLNSWNKK